MTLMSHCTNRMVQKICFFSEIIFPLRGFLFEIFFF